MRPAFETTSQQVYQPPPKQGQAGEQGWVLLSVQLVPAERAHQVFGLARPRVGIVLDQRLLVFIFVVYQVGGLSCSKAQFTW